MEIPFQRIGALSNAHVGNDFEKIAQKFFSEQGILLERDFKVPIGASKIKKDHKFDLGSNEPAILVECKSHRWTSGGNIPSAKITVWNEAMFYFHIAQEKYRKVFFVARDYSASRNCTLATYYLRNYKHLIPHDVEICEYDEINKTGQFLIGNSKG